MSPPLQHGTRAVSVQRCEKGVCREDTCRVVEEAPLTLDVAGVGAYTLMWTPTRPVPAPCGFMPQEGILAEGGIPEILALAAGFAFTEGLFRHIEEIQSLAVCQDQPDVVQLTLVAPEKAEVRRRNVVVNSSCGICGGREQIEDILGRIPAVGNSLSIAPERLEAIMGSMLDHQSVWLATGGTHAAAVFDPQGQIIVLCEDLGRHNALDKAIGHCLLAGRPLAGCGVALTSRITLEMVSKAGRAGLEVIAAVSAASSLAIEAARRFGITLCGFVRNDRLTAFTHAERVRVAGTGQPGAATGKTLHIA